MDIITFSNMSVNYNICMYSYVCMYNISNKITIHYGFDEESV